ncbi:MAG: transaldolase family protein, partial [Candidatus Omnitrophica bacterium]|nr:transaldolase family protein [Candidatus Omnitrophota bacterium]
YLKGPRMYPERLLDMGRTLERLNIDEDPLLKAVLLELTADLLESALKEFSGPISWEVDPRFHNDTEAMVEEANLIYQITEERGLDVERIFIKIPATEAGLKTTEILIASGINVNLTLVFSIAQALEGLRRFEIGIQKAQESGLENDKIKMCISPFLGRWDDFLAREGNDIKDYQGNPIAGIYFAKLLQKRYLAEIEQGRYSFSHRPQIIMASIRNANHIQHLLGADIFAIPPKVLSSAEFALLPIEKRTIDEPVADELLASLLENELFARSMKDMISFEEGGLTLYEIDHHPLVVEGNFKFIQPYKELLGLIEKVLTSGFTLP